MKKKIPSFDTDKGLGISSNSADHSEYDLSGGTRIQFEFEPKSANLNMRVPKPLLDAVKARAKTRGISLHAVYSSAHGARHILQKTTSVREHEHCWAG